MIVQRLALTNGFVITTDINPIWWTNESIGNVHVFTPVSSDVTGKCVILKLSMRTTTRNKVHALRQVQQICPLL